MNKKGLINRCIYLHQAWSLNVVHTHRNIVFVATTNKWIHSTLLWPIIGP